MKGKLLTGNNLIEVTHVTKSFGTGEHTLEVLHDINCTMHDGEFVMLVGASGSGKSTLLNLLGCLDSPTSGSVVIDGVEVAGLSSDKLAQFRNQRLGFIFQHYNLIDRLTAWENIAVPLGYSGIQRDERRQRSLEALVQVGLEHREGHYPNQLSGGEKQRVAIARALVNKPALVLADEPTGNLDSQTGHSVMELLFELHGQGTSFVMVTHDLKLAKKGTKLWTMRDGVLTS